LFDRVAFENKRGRATIVAQPALNGPYIFIYPFEDGRATIVACPIQRLRKTGLHNNVYINREYSMRSY
jgi:hypothetical protein